MAAETNTFSREFKKESLYKLIETGSKGELPTGIKHFFESHESPYGKITHLAPVLQMSETQPHWEFGSRPLGSDTPQWL